MMYPPSMIAAGSIGAAAHGLNNTVTHVDLKLLEKLHQITGIEMVSIVICYLHQKYVEKVVTGEVISLKSNTFR